MLRDVAEIATATDPAACESFSEFGRHLGLALRRSLVGFTPEVVVLGGGITRSSHLFLPAAQQELQKLGFQLRIPKLLDDAPLIGAGAAWFNGADGWSAHSGNRVTLS